MKQTRLCRGEDPQAGIHVFRSERLETTGVLAGAQAQDRRERSVGSRKAECSGVLLPVFRYP